MKRLFLFTVILCGISRSGFAQLPNYDVSHIKNKYLDIPYAKVSDAQKLDIYLPDNENGPFPVILAIHGGAFLWGDKRDIQLASKIDGINRGYAIVSLNYRLSGEAIWPAQIYDCKAAVRWIRANAAKYHFDPDRIVAWGGSAGGRLAALLGTSGGIKKLEELSLGNAEQSSRVQAVVSWFLPTNFLKMDAQLNKNDLEEHRHHEAPDFEVVSRLFGKPFTQVPQSLIDEVNPENYISSDDPPFLIQHGLEDRTVPYQCSVLFAKKLGKILGAQKVHLELFPATGHGGDAFRTKENVNRVFVFINKSLKR